MTQQNCQCTMAQSVTGDGCRYCQPQEHIDRLHDLVDELESGQPSALPDYLDSIRHPDEPLTALKQRAADALGVSLGTINNRLKRPGTAIVWEGRMFIKYDNEKIGRKT